MGALEADLETVEELQRLRENDAVRLKLKDLFPFSESYFERTDSLLRGEGQFYRESGQSLRKSLFIRSAINRGVLSSLNTAHLGVYAYGAYMLAKEVIDALS